MDWLLIAEIIYIVVLILVCLRIIFDTRSTTKSLAYLLFAIFVPVLGIIFYFFFGINYRYRKMYTKKLFENDDLNQKLNDEISLYNQQVIEENKEVVKSNLELAHLLMNEINSPLTENNSLKILINGEQKFKEVLAAMRNAKDHIHIEYYIYEDDEIGGEMEEIMIQKAKEGVTVRFIYDDFGSSTLRKKMAPRLLKAGVKVFPFLRVYFILLANRLNYRNHRKIIVIDGHTAFVGGINVSDRYINKENAEQDFWRDTHLMIKGPAVNYLQYIFLGDWNFCAEEQLQPNKKLFPPRESLPVLDNKVVQISASGPDSERPTILYSIMQAINLATKEILIATPYFIPGESLLDALIISARSGINIKLLVPGKSDSKLVNAAAKSYYNELLEVGVEIYRYQKGFIHVKTIVTDRKLAMIGTANMDYRSFDLNFEVNAIVYDKEFAEEMSATFFEDLKDAYQLDSFTWNHRPWYKQLAEKTARLISPLM